LTFTAFQRGMNALRDLSTTRDVHSRSLPSVHAPVSRDGAAQGPGGALREIADGVDAEFDALRMALRAEQRRADNAETALKLTRSELEELRKDRLEIANRVAGAMPQTSKRLFRALTDAQTRAAAAEKRLVVLAENIDTLGKSNMTSNNTTVQVTALAALILIAAVSFIAQSLLQGDPEHIVLQALGTF
jgi:hypothetical protein